MMKIPACIFTFQCVAFVLTAMTLTEAQIIDKLFLINTVTNANLGPITNGTVIRLTEVGNKLTLQANVAPTGSVVFDMDGKLRTRVENGAPYTLAGDTGSVVYNPSNALIQPGTHVVSATAYSKSQGTGPSGPKFTVQFTTSTTKSPTRPPTRRPTKAPTRTPTKPPTRAPTKAPIRAPIQVTTRSPTKAPMTQPSISYCGCPSCTDQVWNRLAAGYSCGSRITWVMSAQQKSERDACQQVASEYPTICQPCGTCSASTPVSAPVLPPVHAGSTNKCGGAVNTGDTSFQTCTRDLWNPTGDTTQHCYAYGGASDPCSLNNKNDVNDGLFKNPSACTGDTFYLWDEPDTQGKSYTWAGLEWAKYATRFATEIMALRAKGVRFTSPLVRAGGAGALSTNLNAFYTACGAACHDPNSPAYINVHAINAFVGSWNRAGRDGCLDAANFITNEIRNYSDSRGRPWFVTNWSRLGTSDVNAQVDAMSVISQFFVTGSPVQRIYWFGATDYGGNSQNNKLTTSLVWNGATTTLGQIWKSNCNAL